MESRQRSGQTQQPTQLSRPSQPSQRCQLINTHTKEDGYITAYESYLKEGYLVFILIVWFSSLGMVGSRVTVFQHQFLIVCFPYTAVLKLPQVSTSEEGT